MCLPCLKFSDLLPQNTPTFLDGLILINTTILFPSADSRKVVVSFKRKYVHEVLVNRLVKLAQENCVVRRTDRPDMTIAVDSIVKHLTNQTNSEISVRQECPKCHVTIEKDGGCNHMICKNQNCKADFCWVCLGPWEPHGSSWYNCNRYDEDEAKKARDSQEVCYITSLHAG